MRWKLFGPPLLLAVLPILKMQDRKEPAKPGIAFDDITSTSGIDFTLLAGRPVREHILETAAGGVAFIDFDNDGLQDVYLVNGSTIEAERAKTNTASDRLYRNTGDLKFVDVSERAGIRETRWGQGVCAGDINNDRFEDLLITNYGFNTVYLNKGDGTFGDISKESGLAEKPAWHSACALADYDKDGDLDVYISTYVKFDVFNLPELPPGELYRQLPPIDFPPEPDLFFENLGDGRFVDVTEESGIGQVESFYGFGVVWSDFDNDGDQDVFVANDITPNYLFRNNGDKTFTEVGRASAVAFNINGFEQACMGVAAADYDNDGDVDIHVTNYHTDYNTLYRNEGGLQFTDISAAAGLVEPTFPFLGWGTHFLDLDLDGFQDLIAVNGHVDPASDRDPETGPRKAGYRQPRLLFRNLRGERFESIGQGVPGFAEVEASRGLAAGDINNDGHLDLLISNLDGRPSLLVNRTNSGNWLMVKLVGTRSNRSAVGSRVVVRTGSLKQLREVQAGASFQSQNDLRLHFGLGDRSTADELTVNWPDGKIQTFRNVSARQVLKILEP